VCLQGSHPIIAGTSNRKRPGTLDRVRNAKRNRIERMMSFATSFRRIATRHDKTETRICCLV
jgi:transposase